MLCGSDSVTMLFVCHLVPDKESVMKLQSKHEVYIKSSICTKIRVSFKYKILEHLNFLYVMHNGMSYQT